MRSIRKKTLAVLLTICTSIGLYNPMNVAANEGSENSAVVGDEVGFQDKPSQDSGLSGNVDQYNNSDTENTSGGTQGESSDSTSGQAQPPTPTKSPEQIAHENAVSEVNDAYQALKDYWAYIYNQMTNSSRTDIPGGNSEPYNYSKFNIGAISNNDYQEYLNRINNYYDLMEKNNKELQGYDPMAADTSDGTGAKKKVNTEVEIKNSDAGLYQGSISTGNANNATGTNTGNTTGLFTNEEWDKFLKLMLNQLGINIFNGAIFTGHSVDDENRFNIYMGWDGKVTSRDELPYGTKFPNGGYREDLWTGGLNFPDSEKDVIGSINDYFNSGGSQNSLYNYMYVVALTNYHLESIAYEDLTIVEESSNIRYWTIINNTTGRIETYTTKNDDLRKDYTFTEPGKYTIICERDRKYKTRKIANVQEYNYLVDANTRNVLYYNLGKSTPIVLDDGSTEHFDRIISFTETWYVTENNLKSNTSTERVE